MKEQKTYLCKCHPDFHIPEDAIVGEDFDGFDYARKAKAAGVDSLVFFGKCHYGFSYYPTKVGTVHPGLKKDMLAEFVKGCRHEGLGTTCYYSVFLDTAAMKKHPEWILYDEPDQASWPLVRERKYIPVCVNSDYLDQQLIPQTLEIINQYDVDEMFYDTMTDFIPCYCDNCQKRFGKPIPQSEDDANWNEYVNWYYQQYREFYAKILKTIHDVNPDVSVVVNWEWSARLPNQPLPYVKRLVGDLFTGGTVASFYSHYWTGTGLPFDYMCGRFLHHLRDWSSNTPETLKNVAAATIANCGGFYLIDRQLPNGPMEDRAYKVTKEVFDFVNARRPILEHTAHVPETVVLYPFEHVVGAKLEIFPDKKERENRIRQFKSIANVMMTNAIHYTAMNSETLVENIGKYQLLVLPELEYLSTQTKEVIRNFVSNGGKLLIIDSGNSSQVNPDLLAMAGVSIEGVEPLDYSYIENEEDQVSDPILIRGHFTRVKPLSDATTLARLIAPLRMGKGGSEFGHGFAPPTQSEGFSAVTLRKLSQGEVVYVAGPILTSHFEYFNPNIEKLLVRLYRVLMPEPIAIAQSPAQIEMTVVRKNNDLILHFVNHSGKEMLAGGYCPVTEYIPEIRDIRVSVKSTTAQRTIRQIPENCEVRPVFSDNYLSFNLASLHIMSSFLISDYFVDQAN